MSSLFGLPAMLWWGLAAAIPILIHLFARQRYKRVEWAAMDFLLRAYKKTRKRIRLEHLLLLLLRILAILCLIFALAEPRFDTGPLAGGSDGQRNAVIVFDDSFSMGVRQADGSTPFGLAKDEALRLVRSMRRDRRDMVTFITTGRPARLRLKGVEELEQAAAEIEKLDLSDGATDYVGAFRIVDATLDDLPKGADVYFFTDLQKIAFAPGGDEAAGGATADTPAPQEILGSLFQQIRAKEGNITVVAKPSGTTDNLAVTSVVVTSKTVVTGVPSSFSVTVQNFGDRAQGGTLQFFVDGNSTPVSSEPLDSVPPKASEIRDFRHTFKTKGSHYIESRFVTDQLETDNRRALVVDVREKIQVLIVDDKRDAEAGEEDSYFLAQVLAPSQEVQSERLSEFELEIVDETGLERADLAKKDLLILMNVALIARRSADQIQEFVDGGGGLMVYLGDRVRPETLNDLLYRGGRGVLPARILEQAGADRLKDVAYSLEVKDFQRPPFSWFNDPRLRPFLTLAPFYRFYRTEVDPEDPSVRVLAVFNRKTAGITEPMPAFIERTFGNGRVLLMTSSGNQEWNDLPVIQYSYVPLVYETMYHLVRRGLEIDNLSVGTSHTKILKDFAEEVVVSRDGQQLKVLKPLPRGEKQEGFELVLDQATLERAGVYRLVASNRTEGASQKASFLAVNVDPTESDLTPVTADYLIASFPGVGLEVVEDLATAKEANDRRRRDDMWWWAILGGVLLLALETALSQVFGARKN